ncbi:hypothetical protein AAE478_010449 [Parahypoxylon ruwenzoriense]
MKFSIVIVSLFTAIASAELQKVRRQAGGASVQSAAMTNANGDVVPFNTAGVYKASVDAGL